MKTRLAMLCMMAGLWLAPGCTIPENFGGINWTPAAKVAAARATFNETGRILTGQIVAGKFSKEDAQAILATTKATQAVLDQWQAAVELGLPTADYAPQVDSGMLKLTTAKIAAEGSKP